MAKAKVEATKNVRSTTPSNSNFSKFLPHIVAVGIFFVITLLFFSPFLLDNKMIQQGDIRQWEGMSKETRDFYEKNHKDALWTNAMFGGMPTFQIMQYENGNVLKYVDKTLTLFLPEYTGFIFLASISFYILLLCMGVNPWLAIIGGIAYSLSSYNLIILEAGHNTKMHAIALLPLLVAGVQLVVDKKYWLGAAVTAIATSMLINANHVQIMFYGIIALLVYGIVLFVFAIKNKELPHFAKFVGIMAVCLTLGVLSNTSLLWSTYEYGKTTIRGKSELTSNKQSNGGLDKDYAYAWSYGISEALTLIVPNAYGNSSNAPLVEGGKTESLFQANNIQQNAAPYYWGAQPFTSGPVYIGALICFLFVLGLFIVDSPLKWWLGIATLLGIFLSFGKNMMWFNDIFFYYFPGYNKFRTVAMALVIAQLTMPILALVAFSKLLSKDIDKTKVLNYVYTAGLITGGFCLLLGVLGGSFFSFSGLGDKELPAALLPAIKEDRASMLQTDAFRSFFLIALLVGGIYAFLKEKISASILIGVAIFLMLFDMVGVGKRYINSDTYVEKTEEAARFPQSAADQQILQDKSVYRVFNTTVNSFNDASTSYYHSSVGGYHAAKLRRYQELIENQISKNNMEVFNMLNTKYFITPGQNGQPIVQQNPNACGNVWFVNNVKWVNNADEEMAALTGFNPKDLAVVDKKFENDLKGFSTVKDSSAKIVLEKHDPNYVTYNSSAAAPSLAVFSEIFYQPGWKAFVDGKEASIARADYVLRAMLIPAGNHKIEMRFEPQSYSLGNMIATIVSLLILALFVFVGYKTYQQKKAA